MPELLLFSDVHVHPHKKSVERLHDCLKVLEWVFQTAVKNNIENVLFLGDLFHDRQKIDILTYQKTYEVFEKYLFPEPPFNLYLLLGNHDLWHSTKWDVSSVIPLRNLPGVTVIAEPSTLKIAGAEISFLPYTHDPISDLAKITNNGKRRILCGHVAVDGASLNTAGSVSDTSIEHDGEMVKITPEIFNGWDDVFLGHYHVSQRMTHNVEYIGSPLELNFGEANQKKHIIIYNSDTGARQYIKNDFSPLHLIIKEQDLDKHQLAGNFVRVVVDDIGSSELSEIKTKLLAENIATLEIKQKEKFDQDVNIEDAKAILMSGDQMLEKYIEQTDLNGLDKNKLLEVGRRICQPVA
jgi:DNA repair exonuclease SbcCD nuclease subunit